MKLKISLMLVVLSLAGCSTGHRNYVTLCYDKNNQQVNCSSASVHSTQAYRSGAAASHAGNAASQAGNAASTHTMHHTSPPPPPPSSF